MRILFLRGRGVGKIGAPMKFHQFEQAVSKIATCEHAGSGWSLYRRGETLDQTVQRVMPDADWVLDRERRYEKFSVNRCYKIGAYLSDLHGRYSLDIYEPLDQISYVNKFGYDAAFLKYKYIHGSTCSSNIFLKKLKPKVLFLPWSVNPEEFKPLKNKRWNIAFIGTLGNPEVYPLRHEIWNNLPTYYTGRKLKVLMKTRPTKAQLISRAKGNPKFFVGRKYADALGRTRFFIFGCSIYRYSLIKFFEAMSAGCTVFADAPSSARELGFVDGVTYVGINRNNWQTKVEYHLNNPGDARKIALNARKLILRKHSHEIRAKQFLKMLKSFR